MIKNIVAMFGLTVKQLLIGLIIVTGIIIVAAIVVMLVRRGPRVSHEGATLGIPCSVMKETDPQKIIIIFPKGYTYENLLALSKKFQGAVNVNKYDPGFLDAYWATYMGLYLYSQHFSKEVKVEGEFVAAFYTFAGKEPQGAFCEAFVAGVIDAMNAGKGLRYTPLTAEEMKAIDQTVMTSTSSAPAQAPSESATYQSIGEGGGSYTSGWTPSPAMLQKTLKASFKPYAAVGPIGETGNKLFFGPEPKDTLSASLVQATGREARRHQGYAPNKTMLRGPKTVETFSHYYAGLPKVPTAAFLRPEEITRMNVTNMDLRPAPADMRLHHMGPYSMAQSYYHPNDGREIVTATS